MNRYNLKTTGVQGSGSVMSAENNKDNSSPNQTSSKIKSDTIYSVMKGKK